MSEITRRAALGLGVLAVAAGCSTTTESGSSGGEAAGQITYAIWDVNQKPAMEKLIKEFTAKNPKIDVKLQLIPWKDYWTKLKTQISSKTLPDVFWMNGPNFQLYAANNQLEPLTKVIEDKSLDMANYPQQLVTMYSWEGVNYGVPKDYDTVAVWYNKKLFARAGVPEPTGDWTWADYQKTAKQITDKLKGEGIWGSAEVFSNTASYYHSIAQAGGHVISPDGTRSGYGDPKTQQGIQFWVDLIKSGACPDLNYLAENPSYSLFENGKAAMQWSGSWRVAPMAASPVKGDVAVVPLPREEKQATVGG